MTDNEKLEALYTEIAKDSFKNPLSMSVYRKILIYLYDRLKPLFSGYANKVTPISTDTILINDSADSNKVKYITVGSLPTGGGGVSDGDKGDIVVSSSGTVWTIDSLAVTNAKINDVAWSKVSGTPTTLAGYGISDAQPLDSDLSAISSLAPTNDDFIQRKAGAWTNRTVAQVKSDLGLSGTNSGDQTTIVGITGTKAEFNTAVTDGDILFVGDVTSYTNEEAQDAVGSILSDAGDIDFNYDDATPNITATVKTGSITLAKIANMNANRLIGRVTAGVGEVEEVRLQGGIESDGVSAIQTSAFTGDVTKSSGDTVLTLDKTSISGKTLVTPVGTDHVLIGDASDSDNLKKATVQSIVDLASAGSGLTQAQVLARGLGC